MTAPYTFVSEVGTKRVVHALEETIWTTVHVTDETDLEKIEDYVIAKDLRRTEPRSLHEERVRRLCWKRNSEWLG
jgi:hypothetical protein